MSKMLPKVSNVEEAVTRLRNWVIETPVLESDILNERAGTRVLIKAESLQRGGSFKIRGALNHLLQLSSDECRAGVVAFSSGNHAQGVALAAKWLGIKATVVMPKDAPKIKMLNTQALGAEIVLYDRYSEDREHIASKIAEERSLALVPAFDHPDIIAGQGTVGLELAHWTKARGLQLGEVFVPCGGGGLSAGCGLALKSEFPECSVFAVEPDGYDDTTRSLETGDREMVQGHPPTICDALMVPAPGLMTFALNQELLSGGVTVNDTQVSHAIAFAATHLKLVLEPSGAVALAVVLNRSAFKPECVGVVLSGSNVDPEVFLVSLKRHPLP